MNKMNWKGILAALLCLMLLCAGALAEDGGANDGGFGEGEACTHEGTLTTQDIWGASSYSSNGESGHTKSIAVTVESSCGACGYYASNPGEPIVTTEGHQFHGENRCHLCGYTCAHPEGKRDIRDTFCEDETAKDNGDGTHTVTYVNPQVFFICGVCNQGSTAPTTKDPAVVGHSFLGGKCFCGAVDTCDHEGRTWDHEGMKDETYARLNETQHTVYYTALNVYTCSDCGSMFDEEGEQKSKPEDHNFKDGKCKDCGFCKHERHNAETGACSACGESIGHNFSSGRCSCGKECPHSETTSAKGTTVTACAKKDAAYHTVTVTTPVTTTCDACGAVTDTSEDTQSTNEKHTFNAEGACTADGCGFVCDHEGMTSESRGDAITTVSPKDAAYHTVTVSTPVTTTCSNCGLVTGTTADTQSSDEAHSFEDGVCSATGCGYACAHSWTQSGTETKTTYEPFKADTGAWNQADHYKVETLVTTYACGLCGDTKTEAGEPNRMPDPHQIGADGVCAKGCGYVCEHPHKRPTGNESDTLNDCVATDDYTHVDHYTNHIEMNCPDCGKTFIDDIDGKSPELDHEYESGVCSACKHACGHPVKEDNVCNVCGMDLSCKHEGETSERSGDPVTAIVPKNETHHAVTVTTPVMTVCDDCGMVTATQNNVTTSDEAHAFVDGVCSAEGCGYACQHPEKENDICKACGKDLSCKHEGNIVELKGDASTTAAPKDAAYHTLTITTPVTLVCEDCGKTTGTRDDVTTSDEAHSFEDGVCSATGCGYACAHSWTQSGTETKTTYEPFMSDNGHWVTDNHYKVETLVTTYACGLCGDTKTEAGEPNRVLDPHQIGADGLCAKGCGYVCEHPHKRPTGNESDTLNDCVATDDYTHVDHYTNHIEMNCPDCGKTFIDDIDGKSPELDHEYEGGVCSACKHVCSHPEKENDVCKACGMDLSCDHANKTLMGEGIQLGQDEAWKANSDGKTHSAMGYTVMYYQCYDCNQPVVVVSDVLEKLTVNHYYSDGTVCVDCGHENTCKHDGDLVSWEVYNLVDGESWSVTADGHTGLATMIQYHYCKDCGKSWSVEDTTAAVRTGEHELHDGVCDICGYVNTCTHPDEEVIRFDEYEPVYGKPHEDNGDGTHGTLVYVYHHWRCSLCDEDGYTMEEQPQYRSFPHKYVNNVCRECGAENPCEHLHTETETYDRRAGECVAIDGISHQRPVDVYEEVWCYDCETTISEKLISAGEIRIENHYFDLGGDCDACGQKSLCDHSQYEEIDWYYADGEVTAVDEKTHKGIYDLYREKYCLLCGMFMGEEVLEDDVEHIFEHNFYMGDCMDCGYENACAHDGATHEDTWYYGGTGIQYVDEHYHSYMATQCKEVICDLCGAMLSESETPNVPVTEPHRLNGSGVCVDCGQAGKPAPTPTPTPEVTPTPTPDIDVDFSPTPAPTPAPVPDDDDDDDNDYNYSDNDVIFRPTAAPALPSEPLPIPEPTAAPAMVEKLMDSVVQAEAEGSTVTVEIVGAKEVMTETEYTQMKALPVQEQILVTLASIGFEDVVSAAVETMNDVSLSEQAQTLITSVGKRMSDATPEEKAALESKLNEYFPVREIEMDGKSYPYFVMEMQIEVDGVMTVQYYGFRMDENGEWIFVMLREEDI